MVRIAILLNLFFIACSRYEKLPESDLGPDDAGVGQPDLNALDQAPAEDSVFVAEDKNASYEKPEDIAAAKEDSGPILHDQHAEDTGSDIGPLSGKIRVVPALIDFGFWPGGSSVEIPFSVQNIGSGALLVTKFWLSGDPSFSLLVDCEPKVLADKLEYDIQDAVLKPGSALTGKVKFTSVQTKEAHAEMRVFSSDPEYPNGFLVHIIANQKVPCLKFTPESLDFGTLIVGEYKDLEVQITTCGEMDLVISGIEIEPNAQAAGFSLGFEKFPQGQAPTSAQPLTLKPGGQVTLIVRYAPTKPSPVDSSGKYISEAYEIIVKDNTFTGQSFLPVKGTAVEQRCATPLIEIKEGASVKVGTVIHLSGTKSFSYFGPIVSYQWEVQQPSQSMSKFQPSASAAEPTFTVAVPGTYLFTLEVNDEAGSGSCEKAQATVEVEPQNLAIFVLTWEPVQPFEPTPPHLGQDLDLHFLHPNAAGVDADGDGKPDGYYDVPWDCFWYNPNPNWDNPQPTSWYDDDPRLASDSSDGSAAEVIVLGLQCKSENNYRVGVHFFNDHGYGDARATLQAYVLGTPVYQGTVVLKPLDLWDALVFSCGQKSATPIPGPSIKHNYVNPSFVVPK